MHNNKCTSKFIIILKEISNSKISFLFFQLYIYNNFFLLRKHTFLLTNINTIIWILFAVNLQLTVDVGDLKVLTVKEISNNISQQKIKGNAINSTSQHIFENISKPRRTVKNTVTSQLIVKPTTHISQPVILEGK